MIPMRSITNRKRKVNSSGFRTTRNKNENMSRRTTRKSRCNKATKVLISSTQQLDLLAQTSSGQVQEQILEARLRNVRVSNHNVLFTGKTHGVRQNSGNAIGIDP